MTDPQWPVGRVSEDMQPLQWNLSKTGTHGGERSVLISEAFLISKCYFGQEICPVNLHVLIKVVPRGQYIIALLQRACHVNVM